MSDKMNKSCDMEGNICSPITSIDALYQCLDTPPNWIDTIIKIKNRTEHVIKNSMEDCHVEDYNFFPKERLNKKFQPKTLVCHDMKNGYLEDKYIGPVHTGNGYTFYRWSQIDIFVYFSHHLITIPPLAWINLSHRNGVPILGTFITEWNDGKKICDYILKDTQTLKAVADALVEICILFQLDGWLLNIENKVDYPENLKLFVQYLTNNLHLKKRGSYVIWYDSVTETGELKWQNELNEMNRCYFDVCDGIFLNYTWTEEGLDRTIKAAQHRILDVYVGLDIFGRGCFGGGKFNSYIAADAVRKRNLSLAIFAQGWTHETLEKEPADNFLERFHQKDNILWNSLWPYLYSHPIKYAFETIFHTGVDINFYDLQAQTCQLTNFLSCDETEESINLDISRNACSCLKDNNKNSIRICRVSNEMLDEGKTYVHRLFSTEIFLNGKFLFYCYTKSSEPIEYELVLLVENKYHHISKIVCHSPTQISDYEDDLTKKLSIWNKSNLRKEDIVKDWDFKAFKVSFQEDTLLEIGITIPGKGFIDLCTFGIITQE